VFKYLPKQRRLDNEEKEVAKEFAALKANLKLLQQHLQSTTGKCVILKVCNIKKYQRFKEQD